MKNEEKYEYIKDHSVKWNLRLLELPIGEKYFVMSESELGRLRRSKNNIRDSKKKYTQRFKTRIDEQADVLRFITVERTN